MITLILQIRELRHGEVKLCKVTQLLNCGVSFKPRQSDLGTCALTIRLVFLTKCLHS